MQHSNLSDFRLDHPTKGAPPGIGSLERSTVANSGWRVFHEDLPFPVAVLLECSLKQNGQWMRNFLAGFNASLAPHGKTTMSPRLFALQLEDGCWGITLATCHQVQVARRHGFKRILLANEVVGRPEIDYFVSELNSDPEFDFYCFVDSIESVSRLAEGALRSGLRRPIKVFLEIGFFGGRCGVRTVERGLEVARAIQAVAPQLALVGVAGFEGLHQSKWNEDRVTLVRSFLQMMIDVATEVDRLGPFTGTEIILSAGGSGYYDLVAEMFSAVRLSRPIQILTRSGCYLTHDRGLYQRLQGELMTRSARGSSIEPPLASALEVWTQVLSRPEPGLAILSAGRRDFGTDAGNPVPIKWARPFGAVTAMDDCEVVAVNDQHANLQIPAEHPLQVGDMVGLGISHPCTTFDKWKLIYVVDDDYRVTDAIETFF